MKKSLSIYVSLLALVPSVALAATNMKLSDLVGKIAQYFNQTLYLLMGFAVVMFVYYVIKYFIQPEKVNKAEAAQYVLWSIVGFFIILSLWGLVNILISTFDLGTGSPSTWTGLNNLFPQ
jgi:predicted membrane channel-forming protein YqfA (hemolysin III family)